MKTPREIIETIGRDAIAERIGAAPRRVDRARTERALPASWYAALCDMAGQDLPRQLFTFKGLDVA